MFQLKQSRERREKKEHLENLEKGFNVYINNANSERVDHQRKREEE